MIKKSQNYQIKGIAILLMLFHHLYAFPDRIMIGNNVLTNHNILVSIGHFCKICVPFFLFVGGYALYINFDSIKMKNTILKLYSKYWKVFVIFTLIGFLFFNNQKVYAADITICNRFEHFNFIEYLLNLMAFISTYNRECWFLLTYIICIIFGTVFININNKYKNIYLEILGILLICLFFIFLVPFIYTRIGVNDVSDWIKTIFSMYIPVFFIGILFAKYLGKLKLILFKNRIINSIVIIVFIIILLLTRLVVKINYLDYIIVPLLTYSIIELFDNLHYISNIFEFIGKNSTNMWLCHSFFCYYFYIFAKIVYLTDNIIVIYFTLFILSLISSIIIDQFWKNITKAIDLIKRKVIL